MRFTAAITAAILEFTAVALAKPVEKRDSCTLTDFSDLDTVKSCSTITIGTLEVPAGETLDLTDLADDTKVVFSGTVTFGYKEWDGPMVSISGTGLDVSGTDGHLLDGGGAQWWDGKGSNGGKTKVGSMKYQVTHMAKEKMANTVENPAEILLCSLNEEFLYHWIENSEYSSSDVQY